MSFWSICFYPDPGFGEIQSWLDNKSIWEDKGHLGNGFWQPLWRAEWKGGKKKKADSSSFCCFAANMFVIQFLCQLIWSSLSGWKRGERCSFWMRETVREVGKPNTKLHEKRVCLGCSNLPGDATISKLGTRNAPVPWCKSFRPITFFCNWIFKEGKF